MGAVSLSSKPWICAPEADFSTLRKSSQAAMRPPRTDVELNDKRHLYNGFGDSLARAFEFAVTPAIFGFLGYLLDRAIGTLPVFLILFSLICVVGIMIKSFYAYDEEMKAHEAAGPWGRAKPPTSGRPQGS